MRNLCLFALVCAGCGGSSSSDASDDTGFLTAKLEALTASPVAGESFAVQVTVLRDGLQATGYRGTISFTTEAPGAKLPAPYTFKESDAGRRLFSGLSIGAAGGHLLRAYLAGDGVASGMLPLQVAPAPPPGPNI